MMDADLLNKTDAWRQIPPEIKIEMMNKSHASGVFTVLITLAVATTCTIALKFTWILWAAIILSPFVFQFSTGKAWRALKPIIMLQFLAVRSAARRFAYSAKSRDLDLQLIFPGEVEKVFSDDNIHEALESIVDNTYATEGWITLFADTVVILSEQLGGAQLEWSCPITHELSIEVENPGDSDYTMGKEITLVEEKATYKRKVKLRSQYPAALVVFQKQLQAAIDERVETAEEIKNLGPAGSSSGVAGGSLGGSLGGGTLTGPQD